MTNESAQILPTLIKEFFFRSKEHAFLRWTTFDKMSFKAFLRSANLVNDDLLPVSFAWLNVSAQFCYFSLRKTFLRPTVAKNVCDFSLVPCGTYQFPLLNVLFS